MSRVYRRILAPVLIAAVAMTSGCGGDSSTKPPANAAAPQTPTATPRGAVVKKGEKQTEAISGDPKAP